MDKLFKPMLIGKVNKDITFQGIGGKEIIIEREVNILETPRTIALIQYMERQMDKPLSYERPLPNYAYYGHVNGLGYFVSKDEVTDIREATNEDIRKVW